MGLPTAVRTERLVLERPRRRDAPAIFAAYGSDPEVTRHLTWRTHASVADAHRFLDEADRGWSTGADNAYLAWQGDRLVGATGLTRVGPSRMRTGYLVARPLWGHGLASEMLRTMTTLALDHGLGDTVEALVDAEHAASIHVLVKAGFTPAGQATGVHPNLGPEVRTLERYVRKSTD
ncbi:MAG: [ribosomal protein S5]-alanine N-acetyltransferase [Thermoplasmata archaeon]|jgi:RimJ/RimL family protein N-acetyltransferase|nr:[ribosomal protein S5]-alanine N-acetyltransferase [Thermoplasmata archaeon]